MAICQVRKVCPDRAPVFRPKKLKKISLHLLTRAMASARIYKMMKEDRAMSCCEDGDPYPSKIDGNREYFLAFAPAAGVSRAGA
ncbi:MAG: hypothetical protein OP8BY_1065 [Candidatus Saccharicenans subterraneus]|uniref:Uncharacterized protein n=1 Tax=Candidatus Saccharicenans subterraneus TaxID=2508984 RepID=A0A3E2BQS5_9BACT|nr:MAG: hypothetical protein OP8BY_1065 [Candidatus Saccharicenans subterraneum]